MVTGASGGIGEEFARQLAHQGWQVTLVARSQDKLEAVANSLPGSAHRALAADLSAPDGLRHVAELLAAEPFELLVNNAGFGNYAPFAATPLDSLARMSRLNIDAVVVLSHAFLSQCSSGAALVNVASVLGRTGMPGASLYAATKAFIISFSEGLWFENKVRDVYVMALCPGVTRTRFHEAAGGTEKNAPPSAISMESSDVVREALSELGRRKRPVVVPGTVNKAMVFATRVLSRPTMVAMMGKNAPAGTQD
jgi:uncharacterized protein